VCTRSTEFITTRNYSPDLATVSLYILNSRTMSGHKNHMPIARPLKAFRSKRLAEARVVFAFVIVQFGPIPTENPRT
jgi:hypothetical protein